MKVSIVNVLSVDGIMKTLFNKNRITITQGDSVRGKAEVLIRSQIMSISGSLDSGIKEKKKVVKCKSPLGFYYYKTVYSSSQPHSSSAFLCLITFWDEKKVTQIKYFKSYGDTRVGVDTRPWEVVPESGDMPDHQVQALLKVVTDILTEVENSKAVIKEYHKYDSERTLSFYDLKKELMVDLFGDIRGPRFQSNEEKILSHGFDLKESFRKRKE